MDHFDPTPPPGCKTGLIPRDYSKYPVGYLMHAKPFDLPLIPEGEWQARLDAQIAAKAQLSDIRNCMGPNGGPIPSRDQNGKGYCFPPGTLIRMADGSEKRIEDVTTSDRVVTAEGNVGRVYKTMRRYVNEPLLTPVMWGHYHLRATAEHPLLTKRGYVKLCDIQPGDMVAFPKYAAKSSSVLQTNEFLYERNFAKQSKRVYRGHTDELATARAVGIPGRAKSVVRTSVMPDAVHLTNGFGRLVGLFLAEGHTEFSKVQWSFNVSEKDTFAAEVVRLAESELGAEAKLTVRPNNTIWVRIYGTRWAKLFETLCSHGAAFKSLHPALATGPLEFLHGVLTGWMDGDRQRGNSAVSISRILALNMFDIANAHGYLPIFSTHQKSKVGKDGILRQHAWKVGWGGSESSGLVGRGSYRATQDDTHMWRKVCELVEEPYEGDVFNLEVEGDHSYVAEGVGVHNCWAHSSTSAALIVRAIAGEPYADLSAYAVACTIKGYRDEGGWGAESLEFIASKGIPTAQFWPQQSMSRGNDKPETWANAALHKFTEWMDLEPNNKAQFVTCLLLGIPVVSDHSWWSHSICALDLVSLNPFRTRIWNSWGDSWEQNGTGILEGSKAIPDGMLAPRVMTPSLV